MSASRRRFGTDQKATILKRYLVDKVPMSDPCDEYGIKPNRKASNLSAREEKIARLEAKLVQKNEVISELMEENVRAKKSIGEL